MLSDRECGHVSTAQISSITFFFLRLQQYDLRGRNSYTECRELIEWQNDISLHKMYRYSHFVIGLFYEKTGFLYAPWIGIAKGEYKWY